MKNKMKWLFPLIALALLAPWPIAYAHTNDVDVVGGQDAIQITVADPSAAPNWQVFGRAIGGVIPGDLFYINATENPADIVVNLYLTNTDELIRCYGYLILEVGIYVEGDGGERERAAQPSGEPVPDTFITLQNGRVSFTLAGYARYKVTIDSGCFKCHRTAAEGGSIAPQFFLEME